MAPQPVILNHVKEEELGATAELNLYQNSNVIASVSLLYSEKEGRVSIEAWSSSNDSLYIELIGVGRVIGVPVNN